MTSQQRQGVALGGPYLRARDVAQNLKASRHRQGPALGNSKQRLSFSTVTRDDAAADGHAQSTAGLGIPLGSETVTLSAPCSVSLGRSQGGCRWPDLRINLLQLTIGRPGNTLAAHSGTRTACGAWFCSPTRLAAHTASLALAYLLMPDLVRPRIGQVAPAGWLAFGGPLVWQGLGFGSGQRVPAKDVATDGPSGQHSSTTGGATEQPTSHKRARKWHRPCQAVTKAVQLITGPALLLQLLAKASTIVAPSFTFSCEAAVGLLAVLYEYKHLSRQSNQGKLPAGTRAEAAWHAAYRRAAKRLGRYLGDLPETPLFGPLLDVAEACSLSQHRAASAAAAAAPGVYAHSSEHRGSARPVVGSLWAAPDKPSWACLALSVPVGRPHHPAAEPPGPAPAASAATNATARAQSAHSAAPQAPPRAASPTSSTASTGSMETDMYVSITHAPRSQSHKRAPDTTTSVAKGGIPTPLAATPQTSCTSASCSSNGSKSVTFSVSAITTQPPLASATSAVTQVGLSHTSSPSGPSQTSAATQSTSQHTSSLTQAVVVSAPAPARRHRPPHRSISGFVRGPRPAADPALWDDAPGLMLYGRADHAPEDLPVTLLERFRLAARAVWLLVVFTPFMTAGLNLLILSSFLASNHRDQLALPAPGAGHAGGPGTPQTGRANDHRDQLALRAPQGGSVSTPCTSQSPGATAVDSVSETGSNGQGVGQGESAGDRWARTVRIWAWKLLLLGCRSSGAAFIKWAQWSATRTDLFPPDFCEVLGTLHQGAPQHSAAVTKREIEKAFGRRVDEIFVSFNPRPIASGSVAQVHRAAVRDPASPGGVCEVAVKVRHPGVAEAIERDFRILKPIAGLTSRVRALKGLSLRETLAQFSHTMTAQTDLRVEAAHLARANKGFEDVSQMVRIPHTVLGLVAPSVLVETWEEGKSLSHFCKRHTPINTELVSLGVDTYLSMLLKHNFVHTDLHPGNMLVRMIDARGDIVSAEDSGIGAMLSDAPASTPATAPTTSHGGALRPQLVLIDYGLAEELTPDVRTHFISFLNCIASGNGSRAADHLLHWSKRQACPDIPAFRHAVETLFSQQCDIHNSRGIDLDSVMKSVLRLACVHELTIDSSYAALAVAVCVLVGFATSLDPDVNLMDAAVPCMLAYSLTGRVMGRLYS